MEKGEILRKRHTHLKFKDSEYKSEWQTFWNTRNPVPTKQYIKII